jgi:hypothetical protein
VNILKQTDGQVKGHSSWSDVRGVHASTRNTLVKLHQLFGLVRKKKKKRKKKEFKLFSVFHEKWELKRGTFSLSSNIQRTGVTAPTSSAWVATAMIWLRMREISERKDGGRKSNEEKE